MEFDSVDLVRGIGRIVRDAMLEDRNQSQLEAEFVMICYIYCNKLSHMSARSNTIVDEDSVVDSAITTVRKIREAYLRSRDLRISDYSDVDVEGMIGLADD